MTQPGPEGGSKRASAPMQILSSVSQQLENIYTEGMPLFVGPSLNEQSRAHLFSLGCCLNVGNCTRLSELTFFFQNLWMKYNLTLIQMNSV